METNEKNNVFSQQITKDEWNNIMVKDYLPDNMSVFGFLNLLQTGASEWRKMETYYRCAIMEVETKFRVLNEELSMQYDGNPIETIKSRIKSPESIADKMIKRGLPMGIKSIEENITDVAGIRVICSFPDDVERLAESLLRQDDIKLVKRKDYIKNPKPNGYRGLHLIVEIPIFLKNEKRMMKVEIQLRTIAMDFWASLEHKLRYKKDISPELAECIGKELLDCAENSNILDKRMQQVRTRIENAQ